MWKYYLHDGGLNTYYFKIKCPSQEAHEKYYIFATADIQYQNTLDRIEKGRTTHGFELLDFEAKMAK